MGLRPILYQNSKISNTVATSGSLWSSKSEIQYSNKKKIKTESNKPALDPVGESSS